MMNIGEDYKAYRKTYIKEWRANNKDRTEGYYKKRRENNTEQMRERNNEWARNNRDKKRIHSRNTNRKLRSTPRGKLNSNIGVGIYQCLKKGSKGNRKWSQLVGYSVDELKIHLENQFDHSMNWDNYGSYWHIDHILPKAFFEFDTPEDEEFKKCWALSNLRPLEKIENLKKSKKIITWPLVTNNPQN